MRRIKRLVKIFVGWDTEGRGEGLDHELFVLQNSLGQTWRGNPLKFDSVLAALSKPNVVNVWFSAGYDWNMLAKHLTKEQKKTLFLSSEHKLQIGGYEIFMFPKKILRVKSLTNHEEYGNHYDTFGFFQTSFEKTLTQWKIPIPEIITRGKEDRITGFKNWSMDDIERYNLAECTALVTLMNKFQESLERVGYGDLSGYHGAGSIAAKMLDNFDALSYMKKPTRQLREFMLDAYYGGRIELLRRAEFENVYNYDINSAYPSATRELPNLAAATWKNVSGEEALDYDFGIVNVSWKAIEDNPVMGCFPFRLKTGQVVFPSAIHAKGKNGGTIYPTFGYGAYHLVELKAAIERKLWDIKLLSGMVIENDYEKPFYEPITQIMKERLKLKAAKDFANIPLKLGANSFYGKFAQANRDTQSFGHYNNYLFGGYITAWTRAQIMKFVDPMQLIAVTTDGIYSSVPLTCPIGSDLGEWEHNFYKRARFILPGIYQVDDTVKSRGFPKINFDNLYTRILNGEKPTVEEKLFVGVRKSLAQYKRYPNCGFYLIKKKIDWNSQQKRIFVTNDYSEPVEPAFNNKEIARSKQYDCRKIPKDRLLTEEFGDMVHDTFD